MGRVCCGFTGAAGFSSRLSFPVGAISLSTVWFASAYRLVLFGGSWSGCGVSSNSNCLGCGSGCAGRSCRVTNVGSGGTGSGLGIYWGNCQIINRCSSKDSNRQTMKSCGLLIFFFAREWWSRCISSSISRAALKDQMSRRLLEENRLTVLGPLVINEAIQCPVGHYCRSRILVPLLLRRRETCI